MSDFYTSKAVEPIAKESLIDKLWRCEEIGKLKLKGYSYSDIAELKGVSRKEAKELADEYINVIRRQVEEDPYFLDRLQENTLRFLAEFEEISKETWETVTIATDAGMVTARINALKLAGELASQRARLLQLLGGKVDSGYIARMQKAESINQILSNVIKEIVADCDRCRDEARLRLAEAFHLMGDTDSATNAEPLDDIEDAELVEDEDTEA